MDEIWKTLAGLDSDMAPHPVASLCPVRIEGWRKGREHRFLAMAASRDEVSVTVATLDLDHGNLLIGERSLAVMARHPKSQVPFPAILAPRDAVVDAISKAPYRTDIHEVFHFDGIRPERLLRELTAFALAEVKDPEGRGYGPSGIRLLRAAVPQQGPNLFAEAESYGYSSRTSGYYNRVGYHEAMKDHGTFDPPLVLVCDPARGARPDLVSFGGAKATVTEQDVRAAIHQAFKAASLPIMRFYSGIRARDVSSILGPDCWEPWLFDHYAAEGAAGKHRRQAGRLYPCFAPILAKDPELRRLVDAGRPYEERLRDVVREWVPAESRDKVGTALVRRFRHRRGPTTFLSVSWDVRSATKVPVDWLPQTARDWPVFSDLARALEEHEEGLGLDLADLLRPGDWKSYGAPGPGNHVSGLDYLPQTLDVLRRFMDTLVEPVAKWVDREEGLHWRWAHGLPQLAGRLLYGGKTLAGMRRVSDEWHGALGAFEAALPRHVSGSSWPALVAPYAASNGVVLEALTDVAQLREEGSAHPDRTGAPGLNHCVGGYGRDCYAGGSHILSVRRPLPDGGYERLSTLQVISVETGADAGHPPHAFIVAQHMAHSNGAPAPEAVAAVDEFMGMLGDPVRSEALVNPEALRTRDGSGFDDDYDWTVPGNLRQAFAAWAPHLPPSIAKEGWEGLAARILAVIAPDAALVEDAGPSLQP